MKRTLILLLALAIVSSLFATDYEIGNGVALRVNPDFSYEFIEGAKKNSDLVGSHYILSLKDTVDVGWGHMIEEETYLAPYDEEIGKLMAIVLISEMPELSFIMLSEDTLLLASSDGDSTLLKYKVTNERVLIFETGDVFGIFSPDYSFFLAQGELDVPLIFNKVN